MPAAELTKPHALVARHLTPTDGTGRGDAQMGERDFVFNGFGSSERDCHNVPSTHRTEGWLPECASRGLTGHCARSQTEPLDRLAQDADTLVELIDGHKLAGTMGDADVSGTEDDRLGAQGNHAGSLSTEGDAS